MHATYPAYLDYVGKKQQLALVACLCIHEEFFRKPATVRTVLLVLPRPFQETKRVTGVSG
jgi:hypothetical protein